MEFNRNCRIGFSFLATTRLEGNYACGNLVLSENEAA